VDLERQWYVIQAPKNRIARRFGVNIFGVVHAILYCIRQNPPGAHGAKRKKKSDFGQQLEEKQKLKAIYGMIPQKQLVRYYQEALRQKGVTAHLFLRRLECRLDNVVYRP
jgi:small subunit ribosomal protein S4